MKEAYVSYETSLLLAEKGFDEETLWYYNSNGACEPYSAWVAAKNYDYSPMPTIQMACAWLREEHGIFIAINNDDLDFNWQCYDLINRGSTLDPKILSDSYAGYKTYEEAVEAALKYTLENLIK